MSTRVQRYFPNGQGLAGPQAEFGSKSTFKTSLAERFRSYAKTWAYTDGEADQIAEAARQAAEDLWWMDTTYNSTPQTLNTLASNAGLPGPRTVQRRRSAAHENGSTSNGGGGSTNGGNGSTNRSNGSTNGGGPQNNMPEGFFEDLQEAMTRPADQSSPAQTAGFGTLAKIALIGAGAGLASKWVKEQFFD
jgi:hypothetical protein